MYLHLKRLFFIFIIGLLLPGCNPEKNKTVPVSLPDILENPETTFLYYNEQSLKTADSTYGVIFTTLADNEKYELLQEHLFYYEKRTHKTDFFEANSAFSKGWLCINKLQYDSAVFFFDKAIPFYQKANTRENAAFSYWGKGIGYYYLAEYGKSLAAHYKSLKIYESLKDSLKINQVKTSIASTLIAEGEYNKAFELCESTLPYYLGQKDHNNISYVHSLIFQVFYYQGYYDEALKYANLSLDEALKTDNPLGIGASYNNLASLYMNLKKWEDALNAYKLSKHWVEKSGNRNNTVILDLNMAKCLWYLGKDTKAKSIVSAVIDSVQNNNQKNILAHSYDMLYKIEKEAGNHQTALYYYELQNAVNDSIFNSEKHEIIQELNIRYESSEKERKIQQINAERQAGNMRQAILALSLAAMIALGGMLILFLAGKNKRQKLILSNKQLEIEGYQKDLDSFMERVMEKNRLIKHLQEQNVLSETGSIKSQTRSEEMNPVNQLYQMKILTDSDWHQFKQLFDRAFPGIITKLRTQYPDITAAEERSFLLIRLNITNKESADMLGISLQGVKKNRYRLKKRFGLPEEQDLDEFVKRSK